jgi:hypothetical protein
MEKLVVEILQEVVTKVALTIPGVRFEYGHPSDIAATLAAYSATAEYRIQKFPLIGLLLDFPQSKGTRPDVQTSPRLNLFIATSTTATFTPVQRTENSFKPVLYPIRDEFFKQLGKHPLILKPEANQWNYQQVDRYQWGKGGLTYYENGKENAFNDYIDAIEITGLELDILNC